MKHLIRGVFILIVISALVSPMWVVKANRAPQSIDEVTNLSGQMVPGGEVNSFEISPDGNYVVFRADKHLLGTTELYSVNLQTLEVVKLNTNLTDCYDVSNILISPDSQWVVYSVLNSSNNGRYLRSVPIGGGDVKFISHPLMASSRFVRDFQITPDSDYVIFTCDFSTEDITELYKSPITGVHLAIPPNPAVLPEKLNAVLADNYSIYHFNLSPDGNFIIYSDLLGGYQRSLWHVSISGGTNTKISTDVTGFAISDFLISPNNNRVVYLMKDYGSSYQRLFSVLPTGGAATRLDKPTLTEGSIDQFRISSDGAYVVFTGSLDDAGKLEIYSAPIAEPDTSMKKLNSTLVSGGNIDCGLDNDYNDFAISPDGANVVYCADNAVDGRYEIFKRSTSGNTVVTRLNQAPSLGYGVYTFKISPDSTRVVYSGQFSNDTYTEGYSVSINGGASVRYAEFALAMQRSVFSLNVTPDSLHTVFTIGSSDGSTEGQRLYKSPITGGLAGIMTPNPSNTGHVYFRNIDFTPDSQKGIVISDMGTDTIDELFMVEYDLAQVFLPMTIKP
ncbi:MAG: hypothetical protein JW908_17165 [Anaerolineales bacterium]|nr:hypothetical protein [Anaerolineales bacterium]